MADENATSPAIEGADAVAPVAAEPKKQRAPRQKKAAAEAAAPVAVAKTPRKKRGEKPAEVAAPVVVESKPARGRKAASKPVTRAKATATAVPADEFADLIALEEENKALRKALSEKLQAENADLRKRLGQA